MRVSSCHLTSYCAAALKDLLHWELRSTGLTCICCMLASIALLIQHTPCFSAYSYRICASDAAATAAVVCAAEMRRPFRKLKILVRLLRCSKCAVIQKIITWRTWKIVYAAAAGSRLDGRRKVSLAFAYERFVLAQRLNLGAAARIPKLAGVLESCRCTG